MTSAAPRVGALRRSPFVAALTVLPVLGTLAGAVAAVVPLVRHASTVKVANLATAPLDRGWTAIDAPGSVGSFASFDPIANLTWARGVATAWKPDAALTRIDADRVSNAGMVDVEHTPDAAVQYRFNLSLVCGGVQTIDSGRRSEDGM